VSAVTVPASVIEVVSDATYNALPVPDEGILAIRQHDAEMPLPMPPILCGQVWQINDSFEEPRDSRDVLITELLYRTHEVTQVTITWGTRVGALTPARLAKAVLLAGPHAPWAPASWVERNRPKWETGLVGGQ
jgi:hypothetical protein